MSSHLLRLPTSSPASQIKRLFAYFPTPIRRYSQPSKESDGHGHGHSHGMERAPSTAEEFERVAQEKTRQGFASQITEKAHDGTEEAEIGDSTAESVKGKYKEPVGKGNFHKTSDE